MPSDISQALKESYAQANSADVYLETLEVSSGSFGTSPYDGDDTGLLSRFFIDQDFEDPGDYLLDTGILT